MVRPICWMMTGARPSVGSSSIKNRAPVLKIRAMASICCSPPESLPPQLLRRSFRFGNSVKMRSRSSPPVAAIRGGNIRFSRTLRLAKMPRSSGQIATPKRAMRSEARPTVSLPSNFADPLRLPTMPMIDLSVVVLPAPLRPSSVTTSPRRTSKSTPCRMCDSPYQACSPETTICIGVDTASSMSDPEVGGFHVRVLRDGGVIALGEHASAGQPRNVIGEMRDHLQIVLDHQDRAMSRNAPDQRGDPIDVLMAHARHRLLEQQPFRVERPRRRDF